MAFQITNLTRSFKLVRDKKETVLEDPNPKMTPQEVAKFYSSEYPELTNASIEGPNINKDVAGYSFKTTAGILG